MHVIRLHKLLHIKSHEAVLDLPGSYSGRDICSGSYFLTFYLLSLSPKQIYPWQILGFSQSLSISLLSGNIPTEDTESILQLFVKLFIYYLYLHCAYRQNWELDPK